MPKKEIIHVNLAAANPNLSPVTRFGNRLKLTRVISVPKETLSRQNTLVWMSTTRKL